MDDADKKAFKAAWFDPANKKRLDYLKRYYAFREPPDDVGQRTFLKIWQSDKPLPKDITVMQHIENVMNHDYIDRVRSYETRKRDIHERDLEAVPPSSDRNPERDNIQKQRAERIIARGDKKLGPSKTGRLAFGVFMLVLEGVNDMATLMQKLGASRAQIYEARRLAIEALAEAIAHEQKVENR